MFEAEIMITGYTIMVSGVTFGITTILHKHKTNKLKQQIDHLTSEFSALKEAGTITTLSKTQEE